MLRRGSSDRERELDWILKEITDSNLFVSVYNAYNYYKIPSKMEEVLRDIVNEAKELYLKQSQKE